MLIQAHHDLVAEAPEDCNAVWEAFSGAFAHKDACSPSSYEHFVRMTMTERPLPENEVGREIISFSVFSSIIILAQWDGERKSNCSQNTMNGHIGSWARSHEIKGLRGFDQEIFSVVPLNCKTNFNPSTPKFKKYVLPKFYREI